MKVIYLPSDPEEDRKEFIRQLMTPVEVTPEEAESMVNGTVSEFGTVEIILNEDTE